MDDFGFGFGGDSSFPSYSVGFGSDPGFSSGMSFADLVNIPIDAPSVGLSQGDFNARFSGAPSGIDLTNVDPTSENALGGNFIFPFQSAGTPSIGGATPPIDTGTGTSVLPPTSTPTVGGTDWSALLSTPNSGGSSPATKNLGQPGGGSGGKSEGSFWDNLVGGLGSGLGKSLPGAAVAAGGLAFNAFSGKNDPSKDPNYAMLAAQAQGLNAQGQQLASYLASGTLPTGLQAAVDKAKNDAKTSIISRYASLGLPTDPKQNSQLAAELQNADLMATIQIAQIGQQLLQSGISASGLAENIYSKLLAADQNRQQSMGKAISNFAAALGGGKVNA